MDDVASVHNENENLRKIRFRVLQWDSKDNPLASLTVKQEECIETLTGIWRTRNEEKSCEDSKRTSDKSPQGNDIIIGVQSESFQELHKLSFRIENTNDFLLWYGRVNTEIHNHLDGNYYKYLQQLENCSDECQQILEKIEMAMSKLTTLNSEYAFVSNKTSSLNSASEKLIEEQQKLNEICDGIQWRLHFFNQVEHLHQRIQSPTLSVATDAFRECLNKIDECLEYLKNNPNFKDSSVFVVKYKHCLAKAVSLIKNYVIGVMIQATDATLTARPQGSFSQMNNALSSPDAAFALYYGKYQSSSAKIKRVAKMVEERVGKNAEYEILLSEIHHNYLWERANIMSPAVTKAIEDLNANNKGDHCSLVRSACAFLVNICHDEHRLFFQFFALPSEQLTEYLEGLCTILYDSMRPFIIHINHLETLAEICSILRIEMIEEHVQQNPASLEAFATTANQLLQDVQERLVFRAHLYLQSDILNYNPSTGDLAYPQKLEMMETIALSLQEPHLRRSDSRSSLISNISSAIETESVDAAYRSKNMNSPADLHGMWYPTVRRTLVCLSRLYRCVDRPIFQGLSQEAIRLCIQSVSSAATKICSIKTPIDGELFEIKHLLILREQIAPFRVDFTVKETSLDFSKIKTAAFGLLQKRKQLFSMNSNNALLEFLLEGTPQIKEHLLDSRKEVDRQLKTVCEQFIKDAVQMLARPLITFLEKAQDVLATSSDKSIRMASKVNFTLRQSQWATPQQISSIIQETHRLIKSKLSLLQRSMQLYLSNRDTEFIIFRPIRNNILSSFVKLEHILSTNGYTKDDMIIASCPSAEHVSILLSSASILAADGMVNFSVALRKNSTSSNEGGIPNSLQRKTSIDKKVSFDNSVVIENMPEIPEVSSSTTSPVTVSPVRTSPTNYMI